MNYYIYNNWQANGDRYTLHHWSCGDCHSGLGKHQNVSYGENGVWIGPFEEIQFAENYRIMKGVPNERFAHCQRCLH